MPGADRRDGAQASQRAAEQRAAEQAKEQLSKLTARELKALLTKLGLEPKGAKKLMLARLLAADEGDLGDF